MSNFCLALSGQKQNGKDTVAGIIKPLLDKEFNQFELTSFAGNVKRFLCNFFYEENGIKKKVTKEWIEEKKCVENFIPNGWNMSVRDALINIGDRFREINEDVWIDLALNPIKNRIITDTRYYNEIINVRKTYKNSCIVRIINPSKRIIEGNRSEIDLIKYDNYMINGIPKDSIYDYVIINDGTLNDLESKVKEFFNYLMNRWKYLI